MSAPRKLLNSEIDALPGKAWLRRRFGIGHRLALAWLVIALFLWVTGFDISAASNPAQAFILLVMLPMAFPALLYGADGAVAVGYRLGWTSHRSLYPANAPPKKTWGEIGEQLAEEAKEEAQVAQAQPVVAESSRTSDGAAVADARVVEVQALAALRAAADRSRTRATNARRVLYVVGVPAGLVVAVGVTLLSSEFSGGGIWLTGGILALLVAVAPTISAWRADAAEPIPDLAAIDAGLARNAVAPATEPDARIDP